MGSLKDREAKRNNVNAIAGAGLDDKGVNKENEEYKQMSYYLKKKHLKAITIKTADGELDKSGVVRAALDLYLADILATLPD